ncbi:GNAT family N-acetyltransferase [Actinomadura luteofluorescens]|uniref:Ribosomal protein S18 acetylase RimI-like enzyme n=1 Tax=Actinomadura luteofluorescens TaxID=46163 RepID=A0A7Y9JF24_9ACTN|nr:GNAT family N-acetyltransferase [Actinomadura luteofluorescens]NYD46555.1 ribosomal protein S18 acetylase RimI-like enzyme [Actinomadura luteofluorescens]
MIKVRPFRESDRAELRGLFRRAGEASPSAGLWGHEDSEAAIYLDPYMDLAPDSLFVAVLDGALVGYLTGCLDSAKFPSESERVGRAIRKYRLAFQPRNAAFFARAAFDAASVALRREPTARALRDALRPAHLHINLAPEARGTGAADALMDRWFDRLKETGSPGCHLQTLVENTRAVRFFQRMGFVEHGPTPVVPGFRYGGRRMHQQTMIWPPRSDGT